MTSVSSFELYLIFRYILDAIYFLLGGISVFGFVRLHLRDKRNEFGKPKVLFLLIMLSCVARAILDVIPDDYYDAHIDSHAILQMILDLLPEILFFSCYFMLVFMWIELYYLTKIKDQPTVIKRVWIFYFITIGIMCLAGLIFSIAVGAGSPFSRSHQEAEVIFLATISLILAISFPLVGWYLFRQLKESHTITSLRKQMMLTQLQRMLIVVILLSLSHMTYTLILEIYFQDMITNSGASYVLWLCYFVFTEQLPTILIIYLLFRMTMAKVSSHKTQTKVERKILQPLMSDLNNSARL